MEKSEEIKLIEKDISNPNTIIEILISICLISDIIICEKSYYGRNFLFKTQCKLIFCIFKKFLISYINIILKMEDNKNNKENQNINIFERNEDKNISENNFNEIMKMFAKF